MTKYIFITGGVVSSLGKGITAASVGQILKSRGLKVFIQKFDPYINVDPGTMSPYQHGEVFVTEDGAETDLDLGHYERFIDENLSKYSSVSTGKVYQKVIEKEREGLYDGATIQVIPHITDEIKERLLDAAKYSNADIVITEIGGTVGDIESLPYLEAIRQARRDFGYKNTLYIHNTLVPYLKAAKEIKTKPTQHSVSELKSLGIQPDILVLRSEVGISESAKDKISRFSDVPIEAVFESIDVDVLYQTILNMREQKIDDYILDHFRIENLPEPNLDKWSNLVTKIRNLEDQVTIGLVGKYVSLHDAYLSVVESLKHAGYNHNVDVLIKWIDASEVNDSNVASHLADVDAVLIPGGFGKRATDGKISAIKYARENNLVTFGICYGLQLMLIEYARNVLNIKDANSTEIDLNTSSPVIIKNKNDETKKGAYDINVSKDTKLFEIYQNDVISERFRNSYNFNYEFLKEFEKDSNIVFSGTIGNDDMLAAIELKNKDWFIGIQAHPEFVSRPLKAHPLFSSFIYHAKQCKAKASN